MASCIDMPEDAVFQILPWLPVISLLRFKTVCKSWCAHIKSSTFVTQHLLRNRGNTNLIVKDDNKFLMLSGNKFEDSVNMGFQHRGYKTINSINGIICLRRPVGGVALWNPATKKLRPLPQSPIPFDIRNQSFLALAFDAKTSDYKVVRIILFTHGVNMPNSQVEVYSLTTDSWRIIHTDSVLPVKSIPRFPTPICWNGMCFWVGSHSLRESHELILSFDLTDEVLRTMPLPNACDLDYTSGLGFLNDKIAFIRAVAVAVAVDVNLHPWRPSRSNSHGQFEVWVLHEYGVKESWAKLYTIECVDNMYPKGFLKNGEILMEIEVTDGVAGQLLLYDPITQEFKRFYVQQIFSHVAMDYVLYNESLVSINGGNGNIF